MPIGALGKLYLDGQRISEQGEIGECMFVIQKGRVEVLVETSKGEVRLTIMEEGDVFGEMALFTREPRSATVRSLGDSQILKIDKKWFLQRVHQDPSLVFRILKKLSERIAELNHEVVRLRGGEVDE